MAKPPPAMDCRYCKIYDFAIPANELPVVALPPRAAVHTVLAKPMALQPLLAALQTTPLFAIEDSIFFEKRFVDEDLSFHMETL